ncbi:MAG: hypothetical protein FWG16_06450 [Micrococcales bacterium]|nr:hypothetical protein [Micrococcales bacterium]
MSLTQGLAAASDEPEAPVLQNSGDALQPVSDADWVDQEVEVGEPTAEELAMMAPSWPQTETNQILADAGITPTVTEDGTTGFPDVYSGSAYEDDKHVIFYKADAAPERVAEFLAIMTKLEAQGTPIPLGHRPVQYSEEELLEWARQASLGGAELAARLGVQDITNAAADAANSRIIIGTSGPAPESWPERLAGPDSPPITIEGHSGGLNTQLLVT